MEKLNNYKTNIINIESVSDLHKIPMQLLKSKRLYEFKGKYFEKLYQEALNIEKKEIEKKSPKIKFIYTKVPSIKKNNYNFNESPINNKNNINLSNKRKNIEKDLELNSDNQELNSRNKKNSFDINILNDITDIQTRLRLNSCHISSRNKKLIIKKLVFQIVCPTSMGEDIGLIGSIKELGSWKHNNFLRLHWSEGNIWKTTIDISFAEINEFEFKFVLINKGEIKEWEKGNNRIFNLNEIKQLIGNSKNKNIYEDNNLIYNFNENLLILKCYWNIPAIPVSNI